MKQNSRKFHFIAAKEMAVAEIAFGGSIAGLHQVGVRPAYVTIEKKEFDSIYMTEKEVMLYFKRLKSCLNFGGKIYLEATPE